MLHSVTLRNTEQVKFVLFHKINRSSCNLHYSTLLWGLSPLDHNVQMPLILICLAEDELLCFVILAWDTGPGH